MAQPTTENGDCSVREATLNDFPAIVDVMRRSGLKSASYEQWARLWNDNPFRSELSVPVGWVLENQEHGIVGTLSNIGRMYRYAGEPLRVATASCWAVDPPYRSSAIFLAKQFFSQKNVDIFLNTTASEAAAEVFKAFRCSDIPDPSYVQVLFWVTRYTGFANSALLKLGWPALPGLKQAGGMALYCQDFVRGRKARFHRIETSPLPGFDERFDVFWHELQSRGDRLMGVRTAEALTWQFGPALENGGAVVLATLQGGSLTGYLVMTRGDDDQIGLRRFRVVDIQALRDDADTILSLMTAALQHAERSHVDVVEAVGFHKSKRDLLERLRPHHRTYPSCPYLYRVRTESPRLRDALRNPDAWDASLFDGDGSL